jgi:hypothetical protein
MTLRDFLETRKCEKRELSTHARIGSKDFKVYG